MISISSLLFISVLTQLVVGFNIKTEENNQEFEKYIFCIMNEFDVPKKYCHENYSQNIRVNDDQFKTILLDSQSVDSNGPMDSPWPMKCHDTRHTSQSPYSTENNPHTEKWRYRTTSDIESSPVVDSDGIIYVASVSNARLYTLYPNGTLKWSYQAGGLLWSTPALSEDGTIYVGSWDDYLHAINPNGTRKWRFNAEDSISSSPAISNDGTIYFGCNNKKFFAINPNGTEKWQYTTGDIVFSNPAIGNDEIIYVGSLDSYLYALYPNGTLKWRFDTGDEIHGHPSIDDEGIIYCSSWDGYLYALWPNGTMKWKTNTNYGTSGSAAIADDGTIHLFSDQLRAFYPNNGTIKWSLDVGGYGGKTSPAISSDGTIYVCNCEGQQIVAVTPEGSIKWQYKLCNLRAESSPILTEDGTIYVGSSSIDEEHNWYGHLHAFGSGKDLEADAGGPYSGNAESSIQFESTVFGGTLPYNYYWDFGDGNTSDLDDPTHAYARPGDYIATFTVVDGDKNESSDTANVHVDTSRPAVKILKPENALYLADFKLFPLQYPVIIGKITVKVEAYQEDVGINRICFYVDSWLKYTDYDEPYEWVWDEKLFFSHELVVYAVSNDEKSQGTEITVLKFF